MLVLLVAAADLLLHCRLPIAKCRLRAWPRDCRRFAFQLAIETFKKPAHTFVSDAARRL